MENIHYNKFIMADFYSFLPFIIFLVVFFILFGFICWCVFYGYYKINQANNQANVSPPQHQIQYNSRLISVDNFQNIYSDVNSVPQKMKS